MGCHHKCPESQGLFGDLCEAKGDRVVIIIKQDGHHGVFKGVLTNVGPCVVHLVLAGHHVSCHEDGASAEGEGTTTSSTSGHFLRGGDLVTIPICQIAAFARLH